MATRRTFLSLAAALLMGFLAQEAGAGNSCRQCHGAHHVKEGSCVSCHRGDDRSARKRIAHDGLIAGRFARFTIPGALEVQRGRELLQTFACRRCHTVEGRGNRLASHLDRLSVRTGPEEISAAIEAPAIFMPHFHVNKRQLADLVNVILSAGARGRGAGKEPPQVVHFEESGRAGENVFDEKCGPCHKILSSTGGGLGRGEIGPNLSGLFTSHYPVRPPYRGWTRERLATWLENPRRVRGATPMRPVPLQKEEFAKLAALLR